ncbi:MAG: phosphoribosylglycinamide formyltransferase [Candidatus Lindowbacteria bacterium]|nr:phosphoribosylglycinamide formyltransferase [Candidatus Lindowbacteria bacterium]
MKKQSQDLKLAVFASGQGSNFRKILESSLRPQIALLFSDVADSGAVSVAHKEGIPVIIDSDPARVELEGIDRIILAGYMKILSPEFIGNWQEKIINIHPSLLPLYPGQFAIKKAHLAAEERTGITIHEVVVEVDSGPVLYQEELSIHDDDTLDELESKIHTLEHNAYSRVIQEWIQAG